MHLVLVNRLAKKLHTFVSSSADSRRAGVSFWRKYMHILLVNHLGGVSLPWNSVVRLTDCPDMTIAVSAYQSSFPKFWYLTHSDLTLYHFTECIFRGVGKGE